MSSGNETDVQFTGVTPYLYYEDAKAALDFLTGVFGFREIVRYVDEDGVVREAELAVGDAVVQVCGVGPGYWESHGTTGPVGQYVIVYMSDVDSHHARVTRAGVAAEQPEDKPYGVRTYQVVDPGGNTWGFAQILTTEVKLADGWRELRP